MTLARGAPVSPNLKLPVWLMGMRIPALEVYGLCESYEEAVGIQYPFPVLCCSINRDHLPQQLLDLAKCVTVQVAQQLSSVVRTW